MISDHITDAEFAAAEEAWKRRAAADAEAAAQKQEARHAFWQATPLAPIPTLRDLNMWVIAQNERRLPKWKFRFAPDLAAQIQPKLTRTFALLFECKAIMTDGVSAKAFTEPNTLIGRQHMRLFFQLRCREGEAIWEFKPTGAGWSKGCADDEVNTLRQRVFDALTPQRFAKFTPDLMLSSHCLCCGKPLVDPVSMSRRIGPECWGSASTNLPHMFRTEQQVAAGERLK